MAILKLKPACKDYIWGGRRLIDEFSIESDKKTLAEAWMLSCHPDGTSTLESGETLADYINRHGTDILGTNCCGLNDFPLLIKLIDAHDNLSVQVHPPDDYSLANEGQRGKNEMWYVMDCDENAVLYCGFNRKISHDEFIARIKENSLVEVLNAVPAKRGEILFIPAGTIHALGKGVMLAEIQDNSNVTYRIFDYGRNRPLHIAKALDVINFNPLNECAESYPRVTVSDYFAVDKLDLDGEVLSEATGVVDEKTFLSMLILGGKGTISVGGDEVLYNKGDSFFLTAGAGKWKINGSCDALLTTVPARRTTSH